MTGAYPPRPPSLRRAQAALTALRAPPAAYGFAVATVACAIGLVVVARLLFAHHGLNGELSILTLAAVAMSAWRGGLGPALLAGFGGTAAGSPVSPIASEGLVDRLSPMDLELLAVTAVFVAVLVGSLRAERRRAERVAGLIRRLLAVSDAALVHPALDDMLEQLLDRILGVLEVDAAAILVREPDGHEMVVRAVIGPPSWPSQGRRLSTSRGLLARVVTSGAPQALDRGDPDADVWLVGGLNTVVGAPLVVRKTVVGVLCIGVLDARWRPSGSDLHLIYFLANRAAWAIDRAMLYEAEQAARAEAQAAAQRWELLAEASVRLESSLDYESTVRSLAGLVAPFLADCLVIDLARGEGEPHHLAVTPDPSCALSPELLRSRWATDPEDPHGPARVLRTGSAEVWPAGSASPPDEEVERSAHARLLRDLGIASAAVVPLTARGETFGTLSFLRMDPGRSFGPNDVSLALELAQRGALSLDRAQLYRAAQEAIRAREDFLAAASHELRTPLSHIKGFVSTLRQVDVSWDETTRADFLAEVEREADRLAALIADLLDLSRLERARLRAAPAAPAALVAAAIDRVRGALAAHPVVLDLPDDLPSVPVDAEQIERLLVNLIENAAKYSPTGAPITVWARRLPDQIELGVDDMGPGIPPHLLGRVFDKFFRAPATGAPVAGTGLGLAIARSIALAHGGHLHAENRPTGGARFLLALPLGPRTPPQDPGTFGGGASSR